MITYKSSNFYERQSGNYFYHITVSTPKDFLIFLLLYQLYYYSDFEGLNGISRHFCCIAEAAEGSGGGHCGQLLQAGAGQQADSPGARDPARSQ